MIEFKIPANIPLESLSLVLHSAESMAFVPPTEEEQLDALIDRALNKIGMVKAVADD